LGAAPGWGSGRTAPAARAAPGCAGGQRPEAALGWGAACASGRRPSRAAAWGVGRASKSV